MSVLGLLLLLLLSCFSRVQLCATPWTAAHQAPPSLGFSRQEHWSGLTFPSPMHESEKWKWSRSVMSDSSRTHGLQALPSMGFSKQEYWSGVSLPSPSRSTRQNKCLNNLPNFSGFMTLSSHRYSPLGFPLSPLLMFFEIPSLCPLKIQDQ